MNVAEQINAVTRRIHSSGTDHVIILDQTFTTTPADLWDACTNPERLRLWFEPIEGDLHQGGRYRLTDSTTEGTIETCDQPSSLRVTWEFDGDRSRVEVAINATSEGATLTLSHHVPDDQHWATYGPAAAGVGWDGSLLALALHLSGDRRSHPEEMEKFNATDEGQHFIVQTARVWQEADIATGCDPDEAKKKADKTIEFYGQTD